MISSNWNVNFESAFQDVLEKVAALQCIAWKPIVGILSGIAELIWVDLSWIWRLLSWELLSSSEQNLLSIARHWQPLSIPTIVLCNIWYMMTNLSRACFQLKDIDNPFPSIVCCNIWYLMKHISLYRVFDCWAESSWAHLGRACYQLEILTIVINCKFWAEHTLTKAPSPSALCFVWNIC